MSRGLGDVYKRQLPFPSKYEIHEYRIMADFVDELRPGAAKEELVGAIQGKGAFRRFKSGIRYHRLEQQWYDYLAQAQREIAIRWCEENSVEYVENDIDIKVKKP